LRCLLFFAGRLHAISLGQRLAYGLKQVSFVLLLSWTVGRRLSFVDRLAFERGLCLFGGIKVFGVVLSARFMP